MKLKKIVAGIAAAAMTVSAMTAISASAATVSSIDFENGDTSFVYFNTDDNQGGTVTTESHNGSTQLKVTPADCSELLKLWFDLDSIMDRSVATTIKTIELDLTFVSTDADTPMGWVGGAIGTAGGFVLGGDNDQGQQNPGWSDGAWDGGAYEAGEEAVVHATKKFLIPMQMYSEEGTNPFFGVMKWAGEVDYVLYVDNIVFKDENDNVISFEPKFNVGGSAPAADAATDAPAADTTASTDAPAPATTTAPATGNVPAAVMLSVMAVAGVAAVATKKRK